MTINITDIEIKIKLLKSEATLAQVTLVLFGAWEEKGWRVSRSNNEDLTLHDRVWIQPPCYRAGNTGWKEMVYINDRQLYEEVKVKIYDCYSREKNKEYMAGETTEISLEEVDKANA